LEHISSINIIKKNQQSNINLRSPCVIYIIRHITTIIYEAGRRRRKSKCQMSRKMNYGTSLTSETMTSPTHPKQAVSYERKDATHRFMCRAAVGCRGYNYWMYCVVLGKPTTSGKVKCLVFGDRNWKDTDHIKRIRYVDIKKLGGIPDDK